MNQSRSATDKSQTIATAPPHHSKRRRSGGLGDELLDALSQATGLAELLAEREEALRDLSSSMAEMNAELDDARSRIKTAEAKCWELEELCDSLLDAITTEVSRDAASRVLEEHRLRSEFLR